MGHLESYTIAHSNLSLETYRLRSHRLVKDAGQGAKIVEGEEGDGKNESVFTAIMEKQANHDCSVLLCYTHKIHGGNISLLSTAYTHASETHTINGSSMVKTQPRVKGLVDDGVCRLGQQLVFHGKGHSEHKK